MIRRATPLATTVLVLVVLFSAAVTDAAETHRPSAMTVEVRVLPGPDSCPSMVEVWLNTPRDTVQGFELVLKWDRPDFARFVTERVHSPVVDTMMRDSSGSRVRLAEDTTFIVKPVIDLSGGLIEHWEYVAARGEDGFRVKVTAFASLAGGAGGSPLLPPASGLLFRLPVEAALPAVDLVSHDTAVVWIDSMQTRFSTSRGTLTGAPHLQQGKTALLPCRRGRRNPIQDNGG